MPYLELIFSQLNIANIPFFGLFYQYCANLMGKKFVETSMHVTREVHDLKFYEQRIQSILQIQCINRNRVLQWRHIPDFKLVVLNFLPYT